MKTRSIQLKGVPNALAQLITQFGGEDALLGAAINASYFLDPSLITSTPLFPTYARHSRKLYPRQQTGDQSTNAGRTVTIDANHKAQAAWKRASGGFFRRGNGYGVRHIWGHASDPTAFTATWNLCYMPFWAGMLTEEQHPFDRLAKVIQQIAFDLYFRRGPITLEDKPAFVVDRGLDLASELPVETIVNLVM